MVSHLGRPNGFQDEYSMKKIINSVEKVLGKKVLLSNDVIGKDSILKASNLKPGEVLLLENVRFHKEETEGDLNFAKQLSQLGDCYVNDAFGTAHRAHASTTIISKFFTNKFFGKLLEKEVLAIKKVMSSGQKPILAILGGAKISSKIPILKNIIKILLEIGFEIHVGTHLPGRAEINLAKNDVFTKWVQNCQFDLKLCSAGAKSRARPRQIDQNID